MTPLSAESGVAALARSWVVTIPLESPVIVLATVTARPLVVLAPWLLVAE